MGFQSSAGMAYDLAPVDGARENRYHPDVRPWLEVLPGDASVLSRHPERALFVCWPPTYSALWEVLRSYPGDTVTYIGDHGPRAARLAGLTSGFDRIEWFPAVAMDPAQGRRAELSVWRRAAAAESC